MNNDDINAYLHRINFNGQPSVNLRSLQMLHRQHLMTIPYENLDIMRGISISLSYDKLFEKIIRRRRGGYCFELNGLFASLLRALGFGVKQYLARFLRDEPNPPMRRHRVLHITCEEGDFICDVGVGGRIPLEPLPLVIGAVYEQDNARYQLLYEDFYGYVLHEWRTEKWQPIYAFTLEEQMDVDYVMPSFYCEKHPASQFRTMDMVHIFTEDGRKSVAGREIRIYSPSGVEIVHPATDVMYEALLALHFGICL